MNLTPGQKKALAIIVIAIVLLIEFLFLTTMIWNFTNGTQSALEPLLVMGIFAFPLWWGFRLLKNAKSESAVSERSFNTVEPPENVDAVLRVHAKIELPEYRKLLYRLTYTHPAIVFLHFLGVMMITAYFMNPQSNWFLYFIVIFLLIFPVILYRSANSNYQATKSLHEPVTYSFGGESFTVTGESFNTTMQWKSLYKIREMRDWFLLYTNKQIAMMVPKNAFASANDLETFRKLSRMVRR
jgi:hypothetical protein